MPAYKTLNFQIANVLAITLENNLTGVVMNAVAKAIGDSQDNLDWFLADVYGDRAEHKKFIVNLFKPDLAHHGSQGIGVAKLLGAVWQITVGG